MARGKKVTMAAAVAVAAPDVAGKDTVTPDSIGPNFCICGCGTPIKPKSTFAPGHDARVHGWMRKIEKGEMDASELPEGLRSRLVTCACCGRPILPHSSGMGPLCRAGKCSCDKTGKAS